MTMISINNLEFENNKILLILKEQLNVPIESDFVMSGKDVATVLGYKNTRDAILKHVHYNDKILLRNSNIKDKNVHMRSLNNAGEVFINESGLYSLIMESHLPSAIAFKQWVTGEVLPKIRKTGSYSRNMTVNESSQIDEEKIKLIVKNIALENMLELKIDKVKLNIDYLRAYGLTKAKASELTFKAMKYDLDITKVLEDYMIEQNKIKQAEYEGKIRLAIVELCKLGYSQKDAWNKFAEVASKATGKDIKQIKINAKNKSVNATYCSIVRDNNIQKESVSAINKFIAQEKRRIKTA